MPFFVAGFVAGVLIAIVEESIQSNSPTYSYSRVS